MTAGGREVLSCLDAAEWSQAGCWGAGGWNFLGWW